MAERQKVTIAYKSGQRVKVICNWMKVTRRINGALEIQWEGMNPEPLLMNADEIESIWEGHI